MTNAYLLALLVALALPLRAHADTLVGAVVAIADGDTVTILDASQVQHKIRLSGIDAPERKQPFSNVSRQHLASLVFRQEVTVEFSKRDRYGRIVGKVLRDGVDVCLEQLRVGLAWHFKRYEKEQPSADRQSYAEAEEEARQASRGLWSEDNPEPPWDWREKRKKRP
jgi:endonuclease YncB( thermonuclease family)